MCGTRERRKPGRASVTSHGIFQKSQGQGSSLILAPSHLENLGFFLSHFGLKSLLSLEKMQACVHLTALWAHSAPPSGSRGGDWPADLLRGSTGPGRAWVGWHGGVTCRSCQGSRSAAGRAEPGTPWSIPDTWSRPHSSRPTPFFKEGRSWRESKEGGEAVTKRPISVARMLCDPEGLVPWASACPSSDRQTGPRGLG